MVFTVANASFPEADLFELAYLAGVDLGFTGGLGSTVFTVANASLPDAD